MSYEEEDTCEIAKTDGQEAMSYEEEDTCEIAKTEGQEAIQALSSLPIYLPAWVHPCSGEGPNGG